MEVEIRIEFSSVQEGWLARAPALRLAAVGESQDDATAALIRTVAVHCRVLARDGGLEKAMALAGVHIRASGDEDLAVRQVA